MADDEEVTEPVAPEEAPKDVRTTDLDTEDGVEAVAQQNLGSQGSEGGGEWPDPRTPPQAPAPGAVED